MKTYKTYIALALGLAGSLACSSCVEGRSASNETAEVFEQKRIKAGLAKIGVGEDYEIVVGDDRHLVENTAAKEMQRLLAKASLAVDIVPESKATRKKRIILGRDSNFSAIREMEDKGLIDIRDVSAEDDGFHLKRIGPDIVIAGANPRGVLYGVYAFENFINDGAKGSLDVRRIPYFRKRASGPHYSFNKQANLTLEDFSEEKAAYLSRMGINQLTDQGIGGDPLITSDVLPFHKLPHPDYRDKVRAMARLCKTYGIDMYLWIHAPVNRGNMDDYPEEVVGLVKRPWGGDHDGMSKTLCVSSPLVQKHYREGMKRLVRDFPDVKGVLFYNLDANSFLCTPAHCERCRAVCTDSPPDEYTPWETQAALITLLTAAAHEVDPDFDFRFWGAVHYHGERFEKMIHAAQGFGSLTASWTGGDRSIVVPDAAEFDPSFIVSRKISEERGIPFHLLCELNNLEQVPKSLAFPFHVSDSLKKFKSWNVKNLTEIYGMEPEHNQINSLVMRAFQWDPDLNTEQFIANLSVRQFGKNAGPHAYRSWEEIARAFNVWNDITTGVFPLAGSQFMLSLGTSIGGMPQPILPDIVDYYDNTIQVLTNVEPWLADDFQRYKSQPFLDKMESMGLHLANAVAQAKQAVDAASGDEFIEVCHYEGTTGRPTRKEYAELNHGPIAIAESLGRQRTNILRAYLLLKGVESARIVSDEASARTKEAQYLDLVREDIEVQERFCELLEGFATMQPCYSRTSLGEREIAEQLSQTRSKIEKLEAFLATKRSTSAGEGTKGIRSGAPLALVP